MKKIGKATFNWIAFLTLPIWGGPFIMFIMVQEFWGSKHGDYDHSKWLAIMTGDRWLLE